jgi:hypothetical protein
MRKLIPALAVLALALVPSAVAGAPPGQWGGTADVSKQRQVTHVAVEDGEYAFMGVPQLTGKTLGEIGALGFDSVADSRIGAGAPRYSLLLDDGSYVFASAFYCQDEPADGVVHTDFLDETDCVLYGYSDATGSVAQTWSEWVETLGDARITWAGLVIDEAGDYALTNVVAKPA